MNATHRIPSFAIAAALACASSLLAQASWQLAYPAQSPPADYQWASAFDEARGEAILMFPRGQSNQGWRWNGSTWFQLSGPLPPNRFACYMVWDAARQRVVLFGGFVPGSGQFHQDLWEWNGVVWQQRFAAMPPMRDGAAVAYDRARNVTVMFGGSSGGPPLQDTWEWNGVTWSNANPLVRPSARQRAVMAFDPSTQRTLLYGGMDANGVKNSETWTWNGSVWHQHTPVAPPFLRDRPTMVADLARARVVLCGGSYFDIQTWEWDGDQWHASTPNSPGAWNYPAGEYDPQRREVIFHGGENSLVGYMNQTWRYRTANGATATPFGTGCAGSTGVPLLANAPYTLPWVGDTMRTRVTTVPTSLGALFVSSFTSATPTSLTPIGMPGCDLLVTPDALEFRSANAGAAEWTLSIPNNTALVGMPIHQQALPLDPTANALGVVASNGLVMVPGIR